LADKCIRGCQERFQASSNIKYFVNDGQSLGMIADNSIDFVFSWDSLVHAEQDVFHSYLYELARKLKPTSYGFIHHSNLGAYVSTETGKLTVENLHWRATSVSADIFSSMCTTAGLQCVVQETVAWASPVLTDCFSLFASGLSRVNGSNAVVKNSAFNCEMAHLSAIARLYGNRK
jgi:hypothetical protein